MLFEEFLKILANGIGVREQQQHVLSVTREDFVRHNDVLDSIAEVEMQIAISDIFSVEVPCAEFTQTLTFGALFEYVICRVNGRNP